MIIMIDNENLNINLRLLINDKIIIYLLSFNGIIIILSLLYLSRSRIPNHIKEINRVNGYSPKEIENYQKQKLKTLLLHAYENVPYYHEVFTDIELIIDGEVYLENFQRIPILTKEIIRREGKNLYSKKVA